MTPLFGAVSYKNFKALDLLVKYGGDLALKNFNGANVMDVADDEVRAFLIKYNIPKVDKFLIDLKKEQFLIFKN